MKKDILWSEVVISSHSLTCRIEPIVGSRFRAIILLPQQFASLAK
jgi:hypothetical protein